mgnify:CR=1 FL=1
MLLVGQFGICVDSVSPSVMFVLALLYVRDNVHVFILPDYRVGSEFCCNATAYELPESARNAVYSLLLQRNLVQYTSLLIHAE